MLTGLIAVYLLWYSDDPRTDFIPLNIAGPVALGIILLLGAWRQVKNDPLSIWTPLLWFRIATAVYFGLGSIVPYIGNEATAQWVRTAYDFSEREAFKVGLITLLCVLTVLLTAALFSSEMPTRQQRAGVWLNQNRSLTIYFAIVLLLLGSYIRYIIILPVSLGLSHFLPGSITPLTTIYAIGIYLLILYGLREDIRFVFIASVLIFIDFWIQLLTFAKTEVLVTLIFSYLAVLHHSITIKRILIGIALIGYIYIQIAPIVVYGRDELARINNSSVGSLDQRLNILKSYFEVGPKAVQEGDLQQGLARLCYVDYATRVVSWYDSGQPGNSLDNLAYVLIPRLLWPEKPVISAIGNDLYLATTGQEGNSTAAGLFAESYWILGWAGIPALMIPYSLIMAYLSCYCLRVMAAERWIHLPAVLCSVYLGGRPDGTLIVDVFGKGVIVFAFIVICSVIEKVLIRKTANR